MRNENKRAQPEEGSQEAGRRPNRDLPVRSFPHSKQHQLCPGAHQWAVGGGSPSQARAHQNSLTLQRRKRWSGWGLGLEVPSTQPGCHGHRDKERG